MTKLKFFLRLPYGIYRSDNGTYWAPLGWRLTMNTATHHSLGGRYSMEKDESMTRWMVGKK